MGRVGEVRGIRRFAARQFWGHVSAQNWRAAAGELKDFGFATDANNDRASEAGDLLNKYLDGRGDGRPRR